MWNFIPINVPEFMLKNDMIFSPAEEKMIKHVMTCGGYVSGGCAKVVTLGVLRDLYCQPVDRYIGDNRSLIEYLGRGTPGDIDFFFRSEADITEAKAAMEQHGNVINSSQPTKANWGTEYRTKSAITIQLITKTWGDPLEIMGSFDIANGKVYFDGYGIHWTDEWLDLELSRTLAIDDFTRPNLLWRVNKWLSKHNYQSVRPSDEDKLFEHSLEMLNRMRENRFFRFDQPITKHQGLTKIWQVVRRLNMMPESLISFSVLFDSYRNLALMRGAAQGRVCTDYVHRV